MRLWGLLILAVVLGFLAVLTAPPLQFLFQPRYRIEKVWHAPGGFHPLRGVRLQGIAEYGGFGPDRMDFDRFLEVECGSLPGRGWRLPGTSTGREFASEAIWTRRGFEVIWEGDALRLRLPGRVLRFDDPETVRELLVPAQDLASLRGCR